MTTSNGSPGEPAGGTPPGGRPAAGGQKTVDVPGAATRIGGETTISGSDSRSAPAERIEAGGARSTVHSESEVHTETVTTRTPRNVNPPA